jgi:hypothetical protein
MLVCDSVTGDVVDMLANTGIGGRKAMLDGNLKLSVASGRGLP